MSDMEFNGDRAREFDTPRQPSQGTDLAGKLIQWGLASDRNQAQYVMVGIIILFVILSVVAFRIL